MGRLYLLWFTENKRMGYHLTIVRTNGEKADSISQEEVLSVIEADNSFSYEDCGEYLNLKKEDELGNEYYFVCQNGSILVKNPTRNHIVAMISLANKLNGRVRGDEFETYVTPEETIIHHDDEQLIKEINIVTSTTIKHRKKRKYLVNGILFLFVFSMALLFGYLNRS